MEQFYGVAKTIMAMTTRRMLEIKLYQMSNYQKCHQGIAMMEPQKEIKLWRTIRYLVWKRYFQDHNSQPKPKNPRQCAWALEFYILFDIDINSEKSLVGIWQLSVFDYSSWFGIDVDATGCCKLAYQLYNIDTYYLLYSILRASTIDYLSGALRQATFCVLAT